MGGYSIPGYFENCKIDGEYIKEDKFLGKTLFQIKKDGSICEPGFLGKTVLYLKNGGIYKPGLFGGRLFDITEDGEVKKGPKTVGAMPSKFHFTDGSGRICVQTSQQKMPERPSPTITQLPKPVIRKPEDYLSLEQYERMLDIETGFVLTVGDRGCNNPTIEVPNKYNKITAIAPALRPEVLKIHRGIKAIRLQNIHATKAYEVDPENSCFCSINGILFNKDKTALLKVPQEMDCSAILIPDTVMTIAPFAFWNCNCERFIVPNGVKAIGAKAFGMCKQLKYVYLPATIQTIEDEPFQFDNKVFIACEPDAKPSGWTEKLQPGKKEIQWGAPKME